MNCEANYQVKKEHLMPDKATQIIMGLGQKL